MALRHIHVNNRGEYGDFFLREGSQQRPDGTTTYWCQLTCNTVFGCVGHFWSSMGSPAGEFLTKIGKDYALGKLFGRAVDVFDARQAVEDAKGYVRQDLEGNEIDEATAAERIQQLTDAGISTEFEWHAFINDNDWLFEWMSNGAEAGRMPNPQAEGFWKYLWPAFLDALATPVATADVQQAMAIAADAEADDQQMRQALAVLHGEVLGRWEQRTALSFRLQDLRAAAVASGINAQSPLYLALHDVTATAEAWMHPDTLAEAYKATMARRDAAYMAELERNTDLTRQVSELQHLVAAAPRQVEYPARAIQIVVTCPRIGDGVMYPALGKALIAYGEQTMQDEGTSWSLVINQGAFDEARLEVSVVPDASDIRDAAQASQAGVP